MAERSTKNDAAAGSRAALGAFAERLAAAHLESLGYEIVRRNVYMKPGEIDLVALKDGQTVLVEVRSRRDADLGTALGSLGPGKQRRMLRAAEKFLALNPDLPQEGRIDFVAVALTADGRVQRIDVVENAVEG
jgi:putative endonuclease